MPTIKEHPDHLSHLATQFTKLARRTEAARQTAIGIDDFRRGEAHDPVLNEKIDWFYRIAPMWCETVGKGLTAESVLLRLARNIYAATDDKVRRAAEQGSAHRQERSW